MSDVVQVKEQFDQAIHRLQNVVGTGVGEKYVNGLPTGEPAILVFVEKKLPKNGTIGIHSAEDIVPSSLDNIPTDVIEVGKIVKQQFKRRVRPLIPGFSCGHGDITAGTIGGFFKDRDGDIVVLSNNHVIANENSAQIGDLIYQPGPLDASRITGFGGWDNPAALPYFATLKNFVKINSGNNLQDSAIAKIHPRFLELGMIKPEYPVIGKKATGWGVAKVGDQLQKCGRTTGHTTGSVLALNGTFTVGYDFGPAEFKNCIVTTFMSRGGDSGSVIYDLNMNAVGLLFAGSDRVTIHNPIAPVKDHYGLEIWDGSLNTTQDNWNVVPRRGKITEQNGIFTFEAAANQACYIEKRIDGFNSIECEINTGSDCGATWGTGIAALWANGSLKVNLRRNGSFGGYYNNDFNINVGKVRPNTTYAVRLRRLYNSGNPIIGEVRDGDRWYTIMTIPSSVFSGNSYLVRVGKTDLRGQSTDYRLAGPIGKSTASNIKISS